MFNKIKTIFNDACILFTLLTFILYCAAFIAVKEAVAFSIVGVFALFGLSLILSIIRQVLYIKSFSLPLRILIHYLLVLICSFLLFAVIGKVVTTSLASLVLLAIVTLVYSILSLVFVLLGNNPKEHNETYTSMFKK